MNDALDFSQRALLIGAGATMVMDLWAMVQQRLFGIPSLNWGVAGRWLGHIRYGQFIHHNINESPPVRGESLLGWTAHYITGVLFAALLLFLAGPEWTLRPTLLPALLFGLLTVIFPFFVMQPALGAGIAAGKTPHPNQARFRSIVTHIVFGAGLYGSAKLFVLMSHH